MQYDRPLGVALLLECVKTALHTTRIWGQHPILSSHHGCCCNNSYVVISVDCGITD